MAAKFVSQIFKTDTSGRENVQLVDKESKDMVIKIENFVMQLIYLTCAEMKWVNDDFILLECS